MSDAKKTGSRDISELKQRLGLKKGGAAQTSQGGGRATGGQSGGVVAPPGLNLPPPPPQVHVPNAHEDPFGAMNAMAAVATVQRAPEMVIVHDGKPVENVHTGSGSLLKIIIPSLIFLGVGIAIGKIGATAGFYNDGLKGARAILGDKTQSSTVAGLKKQLSDLDTFLDEAKTKKNFRPDSAIDKQLEAIAAKLEVKSELVFQAKENSLNAELAGQILSFYAGVAEIKNLLDTHVKSAKSDDLAFAKGKEKADAATLKEGENAMLAATSQLRYGVLMQAPTETDKVDFGAKLVELGPPYCGDKLSTSGKCGEGEAPSAYAYRSEPGATWTKGDIASGGSDSVPTKKIVMLLPGGVRDGVIKGGDPTASEVFYTKRLKTIYDLVHGKVGQDGKPQGGLLEDGNKLESRLSIEAQKGSRFSFFM